MQTPEQIDPVHHHTAISIIVLLWLLMPELSLGQSTSNTLYFSSLEDEFPRALNRVFEDSRGYLWASSSGGLARYDGTSVRVYKADINDFNSLSSSLTSAITEDTDGTLWISTRRGLNAFDPVTGQFRHFYHTPADTSTISDDIPKELAFDDDGFLWIGFDNEHGLNQFNTTSVESKRFRVRRRQTGQLQGRVLGNIIADGERIYLGTTAGFEYFDKETKQFHFFPYLDAAGDTIYYSVNPIVKSKDGKIWINGYRSGLRYFDPATNTIHTFEAPEDQPSLPALEFIVEDQRGRLWLSNRSSLWSLSPDRQLVQRHDVEFIDRKNVYETYGCLYVDRYGTLWMRNHFFDLRRTIFQYHQIPSPSNQQAGFIAGIREINDSLLLIPAHNAYYQYNLNERSATRIAFPAPSPFSASDFHPDAPGWFTVSLKNGLHYFNPAQNKLYPFIVEKNGRPVSSLMGIAVDQQENIWITTWGNGLLRIKKEVWKNSNGRITNFDQWLPDRSPPTVPTSNLLGLYVDSRNNVWVACSAGGLLRINADTDEFRQYDFIKGTNSVSDTYTFNITEGKDNNIWIATNNGGLNRYNLDTEQFKVYNIQNGMLDDNLFNIHTDKKGDLWMNNSRGITHFNLDAETFTHYNKFDGILAWRTNGIISERTHKLFWGGNEGFITAHIDSIKNRTTQASELRIGAIEVFEPDSSSMQPLQPIAWQDGLLEFNHDLNIFSISFAILDFRNPVKHQYQYALTQGGTPDWINLGSKNQVSLNQLSPGTYFLHLQGRNSDYIWTTLEEPLQIVIRPPFWKTPEAYTIYLLVLLGGIFYFYRFHLSRQLAKQEAQQVKRLNTLKTRFFTNITHEFRTPLTVMLGLNERNNNTQDRKLIRRNGRKLLLLINQLLDLSKLDTGHLQPHYQQIEIVSFTQYIGESFQSLAEKKYIRLMIYSEVEELWLDMDEEKYRQIISNLLSNAIKFTPESGKIIMHLNRLDDQLILKIKDNGTGILDDELPHIFDRFYQVDHSASREGKGTGIGLALVKELVELMQGTIRAKSQAEKGTVFEVQFPIRLEAGERLEVFQPVLVEQTSNQLLEWDTEMNASDQPTLLIIEDNPDLVIYMQSLLSTQYQLLLASNGEAGIQKAIDEVPDIIITDVMMPKKDGFEVVETLKQDERTSHIPIIMLTAKATQEDKIRGLQRGADAYLMKPFDKAELFVRLEKLIELRLSLQQKFSDYTPTSSPTENPDERFLRKLYQTVEAQLDNPDFSVEELAANVQLSRTQLFRKLKALTGQSPSQHIKQVRLQKAKALLETTSLHISEIAYQVGFSAPNYFIRSFRKEFGQSPNAYRNKL